MERQIEEGADSPVHPDECDKARLVGQIVQEIVSGLGVDTAMMPGNYVRFGSRASGRPGSLSVVRPETVGFADDHAGEPLNSASVQPQSARPHFAQRGM